MFTVENEGSSSVALFALRGKISGDPPVYKAWGIAPKKYAHYPDIYYQKICTNM
jgi:hypothetical protein